MPAVASTAPVGIARLDSLIQAGNLDAAVVEATHLLSRGDLPQAQQWLIEQRLCVALQASGRPRDGLAPCEQAVRLAPRDAGNHRNLAACLVDLRQPGRAVAEFQAALELDPDQYAWRLEYAQTLRGMGIVKEAGRQLALAAETCPDCPAVDRALANQYLADGQWAAAAVRLQRILAREGPQAGVRAHLAQAWHALGRDASVDSLLAAVPLGELAPAEVLLLLQAKVALGRGDLGADLAPGGDRSAALPATSRADPVVWGLISQLCLNGGEPLAALAAIDEAISLAPEAPIWHHNRAAVLSRLGRTQEAAAALARSEALAAAQRRGP